MYGSGFPKSLDIGKAIDKQAGVEREVIGKELVDIGMQSGNMHAGRNSVIVERNVTKGNSGWDGWGTALKPSHEPIVVAMKPVDGNFANNALTWGVAGLWIDGGRVGTEEVKDATSIQSDKGYWHNASGGVPRINGNGTSNQLGRFPANLIHDGSDEVLECFPQTGASKMSMRGSRPRSPAIVGDREYVELSDIPRGHDDNGGSAARFFYCAKASRSERNAGLEGAEPQWIDESRKPDSVGGNNPRNRGARADTNFHPTVKPIELMRYLVRLTKTPTGGTVLDPFMGSGTTGIACVLEGREFIGIEREQEYIEIAEKRIAYWSLQPGLEVE